MARPILQRQVDCAYLIFFIVHLVVMLNVDLYHFWPSALRPQYMTTLRTWYVTTYSDQFFVSPPAWFNTYLYLELFYHIPLCLWAIPALLRDDPRIQIHLLIYAVQTAITTSTCIADFLSWSMSSTSQKVALGQLYVPYLAISIFMGVDMYARLVKSVRSGSNTSISATRKSR